uniref:OVATE domain-containing protein n=1 Tax=Kalanchoe fedtschenkoi TaxID=63787 RepID=A0A7N0TS81_KALFE
MVLKQSMNTKRSRCHRTLLNLKALLSKWCRKLPNPFTCSGRSRKQDCMFYEDVISGLAESELDSVMAGMDKKRLIPGTELLKEEDVDALNGSFMNFLNRSPLKIVKNDRKVSKRVNVQNAWHREDPYSRQAHCASFQLAQKMRELEMMDTDDLEHVLDIEEVLHYYSRLHTPVYIDIVDEFFTQICSDIYSPKSSSAREFSDRGG